jgi:hypothetical protein
MMGDTAKKGTRAKVEPVPDPEQGTTPAAETTAHEAGTCPVAWCPVCFAVTAVQPVKPEAVEHLLKAGAEFFLALRSLIDARADEVAGADDEGDGERGLHKIDIG